MIVAKFIGFILCFFFNKYVFKKDIKFSKALMLFHRYESNKDSNYSFVGESTYLVIIGFIFGCIVTIVFINFQSMSVQRVLN